MQSVGVRTRSKSAQSYQRQDRRPLLPRQRKTITFVKNNVDDEACLVRPYLGRRRRDRQDSQSTSRLRRFSLRNVPLHVNQMVTLGMQIGAYAETMADALALMHWGAQIDANDVEYVLAPPRTSVDSDLNIFKCDYFGHHRMWVLDFDCCRAMSMDESGIEQACTAFYENDPFYPRPGTGEPAQEALWQVFRARFLKSSKGILANIQQDESLAERLMVRIEEEGRVRRAKKEKLVGCLKRSSL